MGGSLKEKGAPAQRPRDLFLLAWAAGMVLALVTLGMGFFADDFAFVAALDGTTTLKVTPFNLYEFASGDPVANHELIRRGPYPWFSAPDIRVRFFRPLSSALFAVDHALFGHQPLGYHLQGLVWYGALFLGVGLVYRRVLSRPIAGWALLLFALCSSHVESVGWVADRHMLIAGAPSIMGLLAHLAYRESGWAPGRWWSFAGLFFGFLAGEAALGALLYWLAYEMVGAPEEKTTWLERAKKMLAPALVLAAYLAFYKLFHFGAAHTAAYSEPLSSPFAFVTTAFQRVPLLLGELLAQVPAGIGSATSPRPFIVAGVLATAVVAALTAAAWKLLTPPDRRALRWLTLGATLSLVSSVGALPGSRLLLLPGVGVFALLGALLRCGWQRSNDERSAVLFFRRAGWIGLFALHVVASPLMFLARAQAAATMGQRTMDIAASLDDALGNAGPSPPRVFIVAASDPMVALYVGAARAMHAPNSVSAWCVLSMAKGTHRVRRTDARTLVIDVDPGLLYGSFEGVFRGHDRLLQAGDEVDLDDARVKVLAAKEGHPTAFEVTFRASSLEDPRLRLLAWIDGELRPLRIPEVGLTVDIPWSPGPMGFF